MSARPLSASSVNSKGLESKLPKPKIFSSQVLGKSASTVGVSSAGLGAGSDENTAPQAATVRPKTAVGATRTTVIVKKTPTPAVSATTNSTTGTAKPPMKRSVSAASVDKEEKKVVAVSSIPTAAPAAKRPAWDTKGRLEDALAEIKTLKELAAKIPDLEVAVSASHAVQSQLSDTQNSFENVMREMRMMRESHDSETRGLRNNFEDEIRRVRNQLMDELDRAQRELRNTDEQLKKSSADNEVLRAEAQGLRIQIATLTSQSEALRQETSLLRTQLSNTEAENSTRAAKIAELEKKLADREGEIAFLEKRRHEDEAIRSQLHNTILELKGNVRVFCRIRPFLGAEIPHDALRMIDGTDSRTMEIDGVARESADGQRSELKKYSFQFDRVFGSDSKQQEVFREISQLVQSALDGYKVCIFAYGQTGSGKTHTMEGSTADPGMIPQSVAQVFSTAAALGDRGWNFKFSASYLEIYNETIRDLLVPASTAADMDIRHERTGSVYVEGLSIQDVMQPSDVFRLLEKASQSRTVSATLCNERSSRSHSVFQLHIVGDNAITGEHRDGLLNLIDLAGSERLNSSGSTGERLKETQHINKSLSCLGDVIHALANKDKHVPYRNSKLTHLLQNSLGGSAKSLMMLCVSPAEGSIPETINSLRFGAKVNACEIGTAKRKV
eukprot:ANDGO_05686.mRNA.1 Kinesin-like protein klpA